MRREGSLYHNTCYDTGSHLHGLIWRTVSSSRILWQTRSTVDLSTPRSPQNLSWIHTGQIDHLTYLCADTSYITYISRMFAYFFFKPTFATKSHWLLRFLCCPVILVRSLCSIVTLRIKHKTFPCLNFVHSH